LILTDKYAHFKDLFHAIVSKSIFNRETEDGSLKQSEKSR